MHIGKPEESLKNASIYRGNFNIYWFFGSCLSLYFTVGRGLPLLLLPSLRRELNVGPWFTIHLFTASLVSWICIWNLFHTPSHGPLYRKIHRIVGWIGIITGLVSSITGFVTAWYERYVGVTSFIIFGITIGGTVQLICPFFGLYYIKRGNIKMHMMCMNAVFFGGCLIPAMLRLPYFSKLPYWSGYCMIFNLGLGLCSWFAMRRKSWF